MSNFIKTIIHQRVLTSLSFTNIKMFALLFCVTISSIPLSIKAQDKKLSPQIDAMIKNSIEASEAKEQKLNLNEKKVESYLRRLIVEISNEKNRGVISNKSIGVHYTNTAVKVNEALQIQIVVTLLSGFDVDTTSIRNQINSFGGRVRLTVKPSPTMPIELYCWVPFDKIGLLAENAFVGNISPTGSPTKRIGAKVTLGDVQLNADKARQYFMGKDGSGIKVGVISLGVANINNSINSLDLPSINNTSHILNAGNTSDNEGTAMLEIIHDLAPGADLYFAGLSSMEMPNDMAGRINQLRDAGCNIIVDDVGFVYESPQYTPDYLANTIKGYLTNPSYTRSYISAAGNDGLSCWSGLFYPNIDNQHSWWYVGGQYYINNYFNLQIGNTVDIVMQWADKWDYARSDYDVYLFDNFGTQVAVGNNAQGTIGSIPRERIVFSHIKGDTYVSPFHIVLKKNVNAGHTPPLEPEKEIRVIISTSPDNENLGYIYPNYTDTRPRKQIYGKEMYVSATVGAYPVSNTGVLEGYSSRGPSTEYSFDNNGVKTGSYTINTPAIIATDGVETNSGTDFNPFNGTSAAAPHIAGIAALYYSKYPTGNFFSAITSTATSIAGGVGGTYNDQSGYGKADAKESLMKSLTSISPGTISSNSSWTDVKVNGNTIINSEVIVTIPSNTTSAIVGTVNFGNANSRIIVNSGGTLVVRKGAQVDNSHIIGNVIYEDGIRLDQLKDNLSLLTDLSIGRWEGGPAFQAYSVPKYLFNIPIGSTEVFQANQGIGSGEKYYLWKVDNAKVPSIVNHQSFQIQSLTGTYSGQFKPTFNATIQAQLIDGGSPGGMIDFIDPWFVDKPDLSYGSILRNRGMEAVPNPVAYSLYNIGPSSAFKGVFLSQYVYNGTFYSVRAPLTPSWNINGFTGYFYSWGATNASLEQVSSNPSGYDQKAVVFIGANAVVTANYKGSKASNSSTAFANNSARKTVRTNDGYLHLVYESIGRIWYEKLSNTGASIVCAPVSVNQSKTPSIEIVDGTNNVAVVFQEIYGGNSSIKIVVIDPTNGTSLVTSTVAQTEQPFTNDLNPTIAGFYYGEFIVVWQESYLGSFYPGGLFSMRGYYDYSGIQWRTDYDAIVPIPNTDANSKMPTVSYNTQSYSTTYHLAWEQDVNSSSSNIMYRTVQPYQSWGLTFNSVQNLSVNCGLPHNVKPSIVAITTSGARISWIGDEPGMGITTVFNDPSNSYLFWYFGNNVTSTSINLSSDRYVIGWSEGGTQYITDSRTLSAIKTLNSTGNDIQITNGTSSSSMYAMAFNTSSVPYRFNVSNDIASFGKSYNNVIANGRVSILVKNATRFSFGFGDISVDGKIIPFTDIPDSTLLTSTKIVNQFMESIPFDITDASTFKYSVQYGVSDSSRAISTLSSNGQIAYRIELIDNVTEQILGVYDNVTYSASHIVKYATAGYDVSTSGIGSKSVRLRLVVQESISPVYAIANKYAASNVFLNKDVQGTKISYKGGQPITEYSLSANYPNPFNPTTTISYAIPQPGLVSLKVYDILGKEVATLVNDYKTQGRYTVSFDAGRLSSGMYIYRIHAGTYNAIKKMQLVK